MELGFLLMELVIMEWLIMELLITYQLDMGQAMELLSHLWVVDLGNERLLQYGYDSKFKA